MRRPSLRYIAAFLLVVAAIALGGLVVDELRHLNSPDRTTVTVLGPDDAERGTLEVDVAASYRERYVGLSNTATLGPDEGMLFVHDKVEEHAFVMRDMNFSIDIIFVDPDRRITEIYHAETEQKPYTRYTGVSKWTIEAPYNWTERRNVSVGDRIRIEYRNDEPRGETDTSAE